MRIFKKIRARMIIGSIISIAALLTVAVALFINQPSFGRTPRGDRLERVKQSPNYRNGAFQNLHETTLMTSDRGFSFSKNRRAETRTTRKSSQD